MSAPGSSALQSSRWARLRPHLGVDTRALAAFRICLGLLLIGDLLLRVRNLRRFYTDDGVLPVSLLAERAPILAEVSLHAQSGAAWFQNFLFAVAIVIAAALLIGYRTRLATSLSLLLLLSLHARNPHLLSGGDALLQHLLFWSLFLPLGERWSVDARQDAEGTHPDRILNVASAAILLQVLLVYGVNAVVKLRSAVWLAGDGARLVLGIDRLTVLFGPLLGDVPLVLELAGWAWIALLVASPLLVLTTGRLRTALVCAFAGMHLGMLLTMHLGIFPVISMVALLPFLPSGVWDRLENTAPLPRIRTRTGHLLTAIARRLPRRSLAPAVPIKSWQRRQLTQTVPAIALVGLVLFNAMAVGLLPVPTPVEDTVDEDAIDSRWTLFPLHNTPMDRWYVAPAKRSGGGQVDAFHGPELSWDRPPDVAETYSSARARKFMSNLRYDEGLQASFARYLCERWDREHGEVLVGVKLYAVESPSATFPDESEERSLLTSTSCG